MQKGRRGGRIFLCLSGGRVLCHDRSIFVRCWVEKLPKMAYACSCYFFFFFFCTDKNYRINRVYNRLFIMLRLLLDGSSNTPSKAFLLHLQCTFYRGLRGGLAKVCINVPIFVYVRHHSGSRVPNVSTPQYDERSTGVE